MYERILVPLDGSRVGEAALPYVEELVSKLSPEVKAEITLFQVLSPLRHPVVGGEAVAEIPYTAEEIEHTRKKAKDYLKKAGEPLRSKGAMVRTVVAIGNAAEEIIKTQILHITYFKIF